MDIREIHIVIDFDIIYVMTLRWSQSIADDMAVSLIQRDTQNTADDQRRTEYDVNFPFFEGETEAATFTTPGDAVIEKIERVRGSSTATVELRVGIPEESPIERLVATWDTGRTVVYIPSKSFLRECNAAIDGKSAAAQSVLDDFESPVQVPLICGAFLDLEEVIALVDTITSTHRYAASVIHSFRYPILRGALVSPTGLAVDSGAELETLVDGFDSMAKIGSVSYLDCLADTMATVHGSVGQTEALLESLGHDLSESHTRARPRPVGCLASLGTEYG